jgi:serine/threonine protein kinase
MIGKTFSHYKITGKLGEGGMGVVYKADDTRLKRTVALKFLSPLPLDSEEEHTRFVREAQAAAALDHPNICPTYEIDEAEGLTFIAMAYIDGQSLQERIGSGPLSLRETTDIAVQVAEGLQEAHERGIVHRDIKSANIMLNRKGQARITDFGLAKLAGQTRLTRTAAVMGTVPYMSPEQALGEPVDHRTDIWSLGVVLYEMLTGRTPFKAANEAALIHKIIYDEPVDVDTLNPAVPPGLSIVVSRAMAKGKKERYASVSELLTDLRNFETLGPEDHAPIKRGIPANGQQAYKRAAKRVRAKFRFYRHLAFYGAVMFLLLIINLMTGAGYLWVKWPLFGYGIIIFFHWLSVFPFSKDSSIRTRMLEKEMSRETLEKR